MTANQLVDMYDLNQSPSIAEPQIAGSAMAGGLIANTRTTARNGSPSATTLLSEAGVGSTHFLDAAVEEGRGLITLPPTASERPQSDEPCHGGRTMRVPFDGAANVSNFTEEPWESEMSEAVASLVSAFAAVESLRKLTHGGQLASAPCELASQSICAALAALDECTSTVLFGAGSSGSTPADGRDPFMTVYSELYLMT